MPDTGKSELAEARDAQRQPRQSRLVKAALECDSFGRFDVTLRNVSATGIGGQGPHVLTPQQRLTVFLPGHPPMPGIVRWVSDGRFGIETEGEIHIDQLRTAHGGALPSADSNNADFSIVPAPKVFARRPGLTPGFSTPRNTDWRTR